jgi:hypothetical protein
VNRLCVRVGGQRGTVLPPIRRWVNTIAHRYKVHPETRISIHIGSNMHGTGPMPRLSSREIVDLSDRGMRDPASELRRRPIPRTLVNKGILRVMGPPTARRPRLGGASGRSAGGPTPRLRLRLLLRGPPRQPAGGRQAGAIELRRRVSRESGRDRLAFPTPHQQHSSGLKALRRRGIIRPAKYYGASVC